MIKKFLILILFLFLILNPQSAYAVNGIKLIGTGSSSPILGGTGAAEPQDTGGILINPAGITKFAPRADFANETAIIQVELNTATAPGGGFGNAIGSHKSEGEIFFGPHMGFTNKMEIDGHTLHYGIALALTSGLKSDYKFSRIGAAGNAFDKHLEYAGFELVPTLAYKPADNWAIGVSPVITFSALRGDIANAGFAQTSGADHFSYAWGAGFNIGTIYDWNEKISLAFSFKSGRWNQDFNDYGDVINRVNGAPEYIWGIGYKPNNKWLLEADAKFIHWRWVNIANDGPTEGGFGWENQWVFGFGTQYQATEKIKLRLGYNYGRSPIPDKNVFANALNPLISEHHLGLGVSYQATEKLNFDLGYLHTFTRRQMDDGQGDAFSVGGNSTRVKLGVFSIIFGVGYKF